MKIKKIAQISLLSTMNIAISCQDAKDIPFGYDVPSCPAGEYFEGREDQCVAEISVTTPDTGLADTNFDTRATALQTFFTEYVSANLSGYVISDLTSIGPYVTYEPVFNNGGYDRYRAIDLAFTLKNTEGSSVLDLTLATEKFAGQKFIKIVQDLETDSMKALICTVSNAVTVQDYRIDPNDNEAPFTILDPKGDATLKATTAKTCAPFGATKFLQESYAADGTSSLMFASTAPQALKALPQSFAAFVRKKAAANLSFSSGQTAVALKQGFEASTSVDLTLSCAGTTYTLSVTPSPRNSTLKVTSINPDPLKIDNTVKYIFESSKIFIQTRNILGCHALSADNCLQKTFDYSLTGDLLTIGSSDPEVFKLAEDGKSGAYATTSTERLTHLGLTSTDSPACEIDYVYESLATP